MVRQLGEAVDLIVGSPRGTRYGDSHPTYQRSRTVVDDRSVDHPADVTRSDRPPAFVQPVLVLVAALAIFEGYHWLNLIPTGSPRPTEVIFLAAVVPLTTGLTRRLEGAAPRSLCLTARLASVVLLFLGIPELIVSDVVLTRALGVTSLLLAGVLVALAVVAETAERRGTGNL